MTDKTQQADLTGCPPLREEQRIGVDTRQIRRNKVSAKSWHMYRNIRKFFASLPEGAARLDTADVLLVNLKRRLSGVTSTVVRLYPIQQKMINCYCIGFGLPENLKYVGVFESFMMTRKGPSGFRVFHARRNSEMIFGLLLKFVLRKKLKLVFTSASQRRHTSWTKFLIRNMDRVIATSSKSASYLSVPSMVITHGIDIVAFQPDPIRSAEIRQQLSIPLSAVVVGCFGRIRDQKGTDNFVKAMIEICLQRDDCWAIVMGRATQKDREFLQNLMRLVESNSLAGRIIFCAEVSVEAMPNWYNALDIYVAPQRWEGFGLTPIEAMACAVPVVATRVGAFEDIIEPEVSGILVDGFTHSAIAEGVRRLLDNPAFLAATRVNARLRVVSNFDIKYEAMRLLDVYNSLLERP